MNVKVAAWIKGIVTAVSVGILVYVALVSRDHITHIGQLMNLESYQAKTLFVLIDLPALVGKVLQLPVFAHSTRKFGRKLTYFSGGLSLACNVIAGFVAGGYGPAAYGVFIVIMFLIMETAIMKIKPAAAVTKAKRSAKAASAAPAKPKATSTARKCAPGCTCGKHNRAANIAPVSPGVGPIGTYAGRKA